MNFATCRRECRRGRCPRWMFGFVAGLGLLVSTTLPARADFVASVDVQAGVADEPVPFGGGQGGLKHVEDGGFGFTNASASVAISRDWGAANASGRTSLGTGEVGLRLEATGLGVNGTNIAFLRDTLVFDGPDDMLHIPVSISLHGSWSGGYVDASGSTFRAFFQQRAVEEQSFNVAMGIQSDGVVLKDGLLRTATFSKVVTVERGEEVHVGASLRLIGQNGIADFSNTGSLSLDLPSGVTFTSDSAVFLSQQQSVAPEPSSLALLGMGSLSLLGYGWRRKRQGKG